MEPSQLIDVNHVEEGVSETFRHDDDCLAVTSRIGRQGGKVWQGGRSSARCVLFSFSKL